jgi:hypothetical protein
VPEHVVIGDTTYNIDQQNGNSNYITRENTVVTQYNSVKESVGLLAHNYKVGRMFYKLRVNDELTLIYSDNSLEVYRITEILQYKIENPTDLQSFFIDTKDNTRISPKDLFNLIYSKENRLILQTCISTISEPNWGRLFVIAVFNREYSY